MHIQTLPSGAEVYRRGPNPESEAASYEADIAPRLPRREGPSPYPVYTSEMAAAGWCSACCTAICRGHEDRGLEGRIARQDRQIANDWDLYISPWERNRLARAARELKENLTIQLHERIQAEEAAEQDD